MMYIVIVLLILNIIFIARLYLLNRVIHDATKQMEEIEVHSESNRQIKAITTNKNMEKLLKSINDIYGARQQERIIYQRRETQIRREIENISHDLRTPLTSIIGYVELIQDPNTLEKESKEFISIIKKRAKILQGFIQDFYELSRIEGENYPLQFDVINVQNTLSEAIVAYYHEFEKKQIHVEIDFEEKSTNIIIDKIQFNRVINNLIQNALKYASASFSIKQFTSSKECIIQFRNDKRSIKEDDIKNIFDRFFSGDLSRNNGSTGLGLTISKLLVEKMKGKIEARIDGELFIIEIRLPER
jgi:signal transduction histidine kinase